MFNSADSFAVFFFTCLALIILGIVFEDELIALEDRITNKRKERVKNEKGTQMSCRKQQAQKGA